MWFYFALITVLFWGVYGVLLHKGQVGMQDPAYGRYKAFLLVGVAYFVVAVVAPAIMLVLAGKSTAFWTYPSKGISLSFIAGVAGAIGAFGALLALGANGGSPDKVMSIIFAGAPIVNALVSMYLAKVEWSRISPIFLLGIVLAAIGTYLVVFFNPALPKYSKPAPSASVSAEAKH